MTSQWARLRGQNWLKRAALHNSTKANDAWLRVGGALGGVASVTYLWTESRPSNNLSGRNQAGDDTELYSTKTPLFAMPEAKLIYPFRTPVAHCEGMLFGRMSNLSRNNTMSKYESEVSKATVRSRYKVRWKKPLGEGGFGAVYSATDRKTGEKVALKQISKKYTNDVGFQREMEAFLHLRRSGGHPNICGLRENFDEGNYFYFSLDLISGGEMFDHLIRSGPYSEQDAARLLREVASALGFMHGIGFVHGYVLQVVMFVPQLHLLTLASRTPQRYG